ncbi:MULTISPECIES: GNAT family N-acetyltransferase [Bacillaceae]|uniref:GNAT family N-acetyltransferase n=1 Tax=Bacillaceae TaxID=186817 RepID=UPI000BFC25AF|nr:MULTISPECIES: GNAT family protein [Bacillaceae]PGT75335.1 GNAT family N-acetyltransferase [Bacillus sp. AFS040349]UGB28882.1 GNAT family N-acetyltransferase [Metabacillus sp. B2-18]
MNIEASLIALPSFETNRLLLRKINLNDLDDIFEFSSDPEVAHHMTWEVNKSKEETLNNFISVVMNSYKTGQSADWALVHKESNKVIGTCSFVDWSNDNQKAEIGYVLNRKYWGQGLASEAIKEVIKYGFETLELNRIEGGCDTDNIGSEKVLLKAGFKYEGTLRKNEYIKGQFRDTKLFSILKEDYLTNY